MALTAQRALDEILEHAIDTEDLLNYAAMGPEKQARKKGPYGPRAPSLGAGRSANKGGNTSNNKGAKKMRSCLPSLDSTDAHAPFDPSSLTLATRDRAQLAQAALTSLAENSVVAYGQVLMKYWESYLLAVYGDKYADGKLWLEGPQNNTPEFTIVATQFMLAIADHLEHKENKVPVLGEMTKAVFKKSVTWSTMPLAGNEDYLTARRAAKDAVNNSKLQLNRDPQRNTAKDSYTAQEYKAMATSIFKLCADAQSIMLLALFLCSHAALLRGDDAQQLHISDLQCPRMLENEGPMKVLMWTMVLRGVKTAKHQQCCPIGALGRYLVYRFNIARNPFPRPDMWEEEWIQCALFANPKGDPNMPLGYDLFNSMVSHVLEVNDVITSKVTHAMRMSAAQILECMGVPSSDIEIFGRWRLDTCVRHYILGLPQTCVLASAGMKGWRDGLYYSERFTIPVPKTLLDEAKPHLFPFLDQLSKVQVCKVNSVGVDSVIGFIDSLVEPLIQDAAELHYRIYVGDASVCKEEPVYAKLMELEDFQVLANAYCDSRKMLRRPLTPQEAMHDLGQKLESVQELQCMQPHISKPEMHSIIVEACQSMLRQACGLGPSQPQDQLQPSSRGELQHPFSGELQTQLMTRGPLRQPSSWGPQTQPFTLGPQEQPFSREPQPWLRHGPVTATSPAPAPGQPKAQPQAQALNQARPSLGPATGPAPAPAQPQARALHQPQPQAEPQPQQRPQQPHAPINLLCSLGNMNMSQVHEEWYVGTCDRQALGQMKGTEWRRGRKHEYGDRSHLMTTLLPKTVTAMGDLGMLSKTEAAALSKAALWWTSPGRKQGSLTTLVKASRNLDSAMLKDYMAHCNQACREADTARLYACVSVPQFLEHSRRTKAAPRVG
eukprot:gene13834-19755_t